MAMQFTADQARAGGPTEAMQVRDGAAREADVWVAARDPFQPVRRSARDGRVAGTTRVAADAKPAAARIMRQVASKPVVALLAH
jgi:hypothetical protein